MATDPIKDLRQFLVECPSKYGYKIDNNVRKDIRQALFQAASLNGKYMKCFFPNVDNLEVKGKSTSNDFFSSASSLPSSFDWIIHDKPGIDPSHPGRPCVRKFTKGEPTYRCL